MYKQLYEKKYKECLLITNVLLISIHCTAVLTENLFMDNPEDCDFLLSKEGQQSLVDLHIDGIISYLGV